MGFPGTATDGAAGAMGTSAGVAAAAAAARDAGSGRTARASTSGRGGKKSGADASKAKGVAGAGGDGMGAGGAVHATAHGEGQQTAEAAAKPPRKPYTMTKARVSWTTKEHAKFLKALQLYDRDWKAIERYVETKTVIQIRSHAQKYFLKVMKDGTGEHVPPPRRKAKNNESDKAKKKAEVTATAAKSGEVAANTSALPAAEITAPLVAVQLPRVETLPVAAPAKKVAAKPPAKNVTAKPAAKVSTKRKRSDMAAPKPPRRAPAKTAKRNTASAIKSPILSNNKIGSSDGAAPDFMVIYSFLAGLFADDASTAGNHAAHLQRMSPINRETTVILMRNVRSNLQSKQMWNQQLQLVGAGCTTFLNPEDAQYFIESMAPKMRGQKHAGMQRSDSDTTKEKNSGDGSGGGSNDAPQQEAQQRFNKLTQLAGKA